MLDLTGIPARREVGPFRRLGGDRHRRGRRHRVRHFVSARLAKDLQSWWSTTTGNVAKPRCLASTSRKSTRVLLVGDVGDPEVAAEAVESSLSAWGRIDVLVNNAGGGGDEDYGNIWELSVEGMESAFHNKLPRDLPLHFEPLSRT